MYVIFRRRLDVKLISQSASISQTERPPLVPFLLSMQSETLVSNEWPLFKIRPIASDETPAPRLIKGKTKVTVVAEDEDATSMAVDNNDREEDQDGEVDADGDRDEDIEVEEPPRKKIRRRRPTVTGKYQSIWYMKGFLTWSVKWILGSQNK
jgi:hypothetical protein